ncbi:MAG: M56 family metallopeptidase [Clostridia bacterium]|nr:M56 family metallopeptidase [Clostridia bacterium]
MPEFFVLLLMQVTIFSSVTALIIIAVKQIFKCRIPPKIGAVLWVVLLLRLIWPVFPESEISIYNLIPAGRTIVYTLQNDIADELTEREEARLHAENPYVLRDEDGDLLSDSDTADEPVPDDSGDAITIGAYFNEIIDEPSVDYTDQLNRAILLLYAAGIAVTLLVSLALYIRARRRVYRLSVPCEDEALLRCFRETAKKMHIREDRIPPLRSGACNMVIGCLHPAVVCREDTDMREAPMLFAHELSHHKYGDNPILLFSTFVTCLFWYNPLIWIVRSILREDLEVLCDARALSECGIPRTEYAMMLCRQSAFDVLHSAEIRAGCRMSATGRQLKTRLRSISLSGKERVFAKAGSLVLCTAITMLCLTNPIVSQNDDYAAYIANYAVLSGKNERAMHLEDNVTVSSYLEEVAVILSETGLSDEIGGGQLEQFRRLCYASDRIGADLMRELRKLRTDEPLTNKNLVLIDKCVIALLEYDPDDREPTGPVLPEVITAAEMSVITSGLTDAEGAALLACYNRGVAGADVTFSYVYTEAMMNLILSRIRNDWIREKFEGFYQKIDLSDGTDELSSTLEEIVRGVEKKNTLYVCDPGITRVESAMLQEMIGAAQAGEREDVYYLKAYEDEYSYELAARLIARSGCTSDRALWTTAEIGVLRYEVLTEEACAVLTPLEMTQILSRLSPDTSAAFESAYEMATDITHTDENGGEYETAYWRLRDGVSAAEILDGLNRVKFTEVRADDAEVTGVTETCLENAAREMYALGMIDTEDGVIDMTARLSCGQSLSCAYRLACAMENVK